MKKIYSLLLLALIPSMYAMSQDAFPQGFESITNPKGDYFDTNSSFAPVTLSDNPNKSGINTSDKVAKVQIYTTAANSGIIKINFGSGTPNFTYPTCTTCTGGKYDRLRFKYYKGNLTGRYVEFEPNGTATSPKTLIEAAGANNEWEYIVIPLDYLTYSAFQIRVNRNSSGSTAATVAGDVIYVDDFEIYNSTDGISTAVPVLGTSDLFSCIPNGNNSFKIKASFGEESNVRIDLISIDGRCENIYNQSVEGELETPFMVRGKGMYFVRMTINNNFSKTTKILSK